MSGYKRNQNGNFNLRIGEFDSYFERLNDNLEEKLYTSKSTTWMGICLSGYSQNSSVSDKTLMITNPIQVVDLGDGIPRYKIKIMLLSDAFGIGLLSPTANAKIDLSKFEEVKSQTEISFLMKVAFTEDLAVMPYFGATLLIEEYGTTPFVKTIIADSATVLGQITNSGSRNGFNNGIAQPLEGEHPYKDMMIQGSHFPYKPIHKNLKVKGNRHIREKLIPAVNRVLASETKGMRLLCIVHAIKEGYKPGSRSYKYNNPGNVGNTDSGNNKGFATLDDGIKHLSKYIKDVAEGRRRSYPLGKQRVIKPYFSKEIAKYQKTYKKSPYLPGYTFTYTGQIDQYVKIYATGARSGNSYLSLIISYFNQNGISLTPESTIQDIIKIN